MNFRCSLLQTAVSHFHKVKIKSFIKIKRLNGHFWHLEFIISFITILNLLCPFVDKNGCFPYFYYLPLIKKRKRSRIPSLRAGCRFAGELCNKITGPCKSSLSHIQKIHTNNTTHVGTYLFSDFLLKQQLNVRKTSVKRTIRLTVNFCKLVTYLFYILKKKKLIGK